MNGRGEKRVLEWEEVANLPAICVCALVLCVLRNIFVVVVGRICSGVRTNIGIMGKEPLSGLAERVCHGGRLRRMTFAKGGKWAARKASAANLPTNQARYSRDTVVLCNGRPWDVMIYHHVERHDRSATSVTCQCAVQYSLFFCPAAGENRGLLERWQATLDLKRGTPRF